MRFTIEQRHLTDLAGRPLPSTDPTAVSFHVYEADTADDAVQRFVREDAGEVIGAVLKFPGFQAVATVRKTSGVYTLQVTPASSQHVLR
jgi:hypothetical protein